MGLVDQLRQWLREPALRDIDVDAPQLLAHHIRILREKRLLRSAFETFYRDMLAAGDRLFPQPGIELELGSGAGFLKTIRPQVITTDIRIAQQIDRVIDAHRIPHTGNRSSSNNWLANCTPVTSYWKKHPSV